MFQTTVFESEENTDLSPDKLLVVASVGQERGEALTSLEQRRRFFSFLERETNLPLKKKNYLEAHSSNWTALWTGASGSRRLKGRQTPASGAVTRCTTFARAIGSVADERGSRVHTQTRQEEIAAWTARLHSVPNTNTTAKYFRALRALFGKSGELWCTNTRQKASVSIESGVARSMTRTRVCLYKMMN